MNKVMLIGNVGKEPEVKYVDAGLCVASVSLATTERGYKLKDGTEVFGLDENPYFVDPTFGDYRVRPDAGIPDIHFEEMGRIS